MRDEFTVSTKELLAKRVAYRCSNPDCRQPTSGPQADPSKAVNIGVAAHITAASLGGPRYDPSLTAEQRGSHENGIWVCQNHGKLIDNDEGHFSVEMLRDWKQLAERRAALELRSPRKSSDDNVSAVFSKVERLMPDLIREMCHDLSDNQLSREFVVLKKGWSYWAKGHELVYYYEDHPDLDNKLRILESSELIRDITHSNVMRFIITEPFAEHLTEYLHQDDSAARVRTSPTESRAALPSGVPDPNEYWTQRKRLPETDIIKKIWSKPRWCVWTRPTEFKRARFQNLEQCRDFMHSRSVRVGSLRPYPWVSSDTLEAGDEWIAYEIDTTHQLERWALFRSGQFVHNRAFDDGPHGQRVHVLEILDTVTQAFEFGARLAQLGVLSQNAAITFDLFGIDGRALTWPADLYGYSNAVPSNCWCQDESISVARVMTTDELESRKRELAFEVVLEIYSRFGWLSPPLERLSTEQGRRFGAID